VDNAHALKMAEVTFRGTEQIEAWKAFTSSHQSASGLVTDKASPWAINTQIITRPSLTLLLVVASTLSTLIHPVTPEQAMAIQNVQILTGTAVAWWFGSRMTTQITPSTGAVPIRKG
jgi:methionyl-tRNA synthetase